MIGALLLRREMTTMVYGVRTLDPLSYVAASATLVVAGLPACAIPARRAVRLDPLSRCGRNSSSVPSTDSNSKLATAVRRVGLDEIKCKYPGDSR